MKKKIDFKDLLSLVALIITHIFNFISSNNNIPLHFTIEMDEDFLQRLENEMSKIGIHFSDFGGGYGSTSPSSDEVNSDEESVSDGDGDGVSVGSIRMQRHKNKNSLLDLKQLHILCFCFIGLVLVEEPVLVNDLIR